jgi:hypothetical protein
MVIQGLRPPRLCLLVKGRQVADVGWILVEVRVGCLEVVDEHAELCTPVPDVVDAVHLLVVDESGSRFDGPLGFFGSFLLVSELSLPIHSSFRSFSRCFVAWFPCAMGRL